MRELNDHTLKDGLRQLPTYDPPERIWSGIDSELGEEQQPAALRQALDRLPVYDPPAGIWEQVEQEIGGSGRGRRLWKPLSIAASIVLLIGSAYWVSVTDVNPTSSPASSNVVAATVSYSQEVVDDQLLIRDWNEESEAFDLLSELCEDTPFACGNPDLQVLRAELDELTKAKEALQNAIGKYGTDRELIEEITDIEMQRTDILKKMIEKITLS